MNHARAADVVELREQHEYGFTVRESAWFDLLKSKGYAVKVYDTPWLDMCGEMQSVDACYTYPMHSPNAIQRTALSTGARLRVLLGDLHLWRSTPLPSPVAAAETFNRFRSDLAEAPRGVAYVVHLLLPHYDYLYRSDCTLADPAEWQTQPGHIDDTAGPEARHAAYKLYLAQVLCTNRLMDGLLQQLKSLGVYDEATIIVHGDHGSRIGEHSSHAPAADFSDRDLLDYFATLLAIKTPDTAPGIRQEPALLQRIFADQFLGGTTVASDLGAPVLIDEGHGKFAARALVWPDTPIETSALKRALAAPGASEPSPQ
jgi:hypothetical protein